MSGHARGPAWGSRLEAVLAAGMARMALVPTDAPKRTREDEERMEVEWRKKQNEQAEQLVYRQLQQMRQSHQEVQDALAQLDAEDDAQNAPDYTPEELDAFLAREFAPSSSGGANAYGGAENGSEIEELDEDLDEPSAPSGRFTPEQLQNVLVQLDKEDAEAKEPATVVRTVPGTPAMRYPVWITLGPLPRTPPVPTRAQLSTRKSDREKDKLNAEEMAYLFWYLMHPFHFEDDIEAIADNLLLDENVVRDRIVGMRHRYKKPPWSLEIPDPSPAPYIGATLAPNPPYPKNSSAGTPSFQKQRKFSTSELKYLYWNVMLPQRINLEEMMDVLVLERKEVLHKIHWMRMRLKNWGYTVPDPPEGKLPSGPKGKRPAAPKVTISIADFEAAVDALVARWKQEGGPSLLAYTKRQKDVTDLAKELRVSANSIFLDLARRHPTYARPSERQKVTQ